jgi:hypothetical protein
MLDLEAMAPTRRPSRSGNALGDLTVVAGALVVALTAWTLWTQAAGVELTIQSGDEVQRVGLGSVAVVAVVVSVAGVLLLRVLDAVLQRGMRWWTVVACSVTVVSMLGPLGTTTATAGVALASLHLLVAAVVVVGVRRVHRAA